MSKTRSIQIEDLKRQKKSGESIIEIPDISCLPYLAIYGFIALSSFAAGRILTGNLPVMLITNLLSMWMMADAARVLTEAQDTYVILTDKRIYGKTSHAFEIWYSDIREVQKLPKGIRIVSGKRKERQPAAVDLKYIRNTQAVCSQIQKYRSR